jgi:hypothetical protein
MCNVDATGQGNPLSTQRKLPDIAPPDPTGLDVTGDNIVLRARAAKLPGAINSNSMASAIIRDPTRNAQ